MKKTIVFVLAVATLSVVTQVAADVIFEENFDEQPDWHSGFSENDKGGYNTAGLPDRIQRAATHKIPDNWYSVYQDPFFSPSMGYPDFHEVIEILGKNADKAKGGIGKSFIERRDGRNDGSNWTSDGQLLKVFDNDHNSLYIEFYIAFDPNWTTAPSSDQAKLFRVGSWSRKDSEFQAFSNGNLGPILIWDWKSDAYGVRNLVALRGGPHGRNYTFTKPQLGSFPRTSMNYSNDVQGKGGNGANPKIVDKVNGGFIPSSGIIEHKQIFGEGGEYTKVAFYVEMNSSPGSQDGKLMQWVDDVQIMDVSGLMWIPSLPEDMSKMPGWNYFAIGGNDWFRSYSATEKRQEWYSIDDVVVRRSIPNDLAAGRVTPPSPPVDLRVN